MHVESAYQMFVITRFCYRGGANMGLGQTRAIPGMNPLSRRNLRFRSQLFQLGCLPSMKAQTCQRFTWILVVDPELAPGRLTWLTEIVSDRPDTIVHVRERTHDIAASGWLTPYRRRNTPYISTTLVDDDDVLPVTYMAEVAGALQAAQTRAHGPILICAAKRTLEWDLRSSFEYPVGSYAPWHRRQYPTTCGFTVACSAPDAQITALAIPHNWAEHVFPDTPDLPFEGFADLKAHFRRLASTRPAEWTYGRSFVDISSRSGPVVVVNHFRNDQVSRLYEAKHQIMPVLPHMAAFAHVPIDWTHLHRARMVFRTSVGSWALALFRSGCAWLFAAPSDVVFRRRQMRIVLTACVTSYLTTLRRALARLRLVWRAKT